MELQKSYNKQPCYDRMTYYTRTRQDNIIVHQWCMATKKYSNKVEIMDLTNSTLKNQASIEDPVLYPSIEYSVRTYSHNIKEYFNRQ